VAITAVFGWCALQARILVDLVAEKDAHTPGKRPEPNEGRALDTHIATLEEAVAKAEALGEQRCQEAQTAAKRVEGLVAALVEMTSELVEMSKRMAEQTAATEKVRAELDDYRSRSWWWENGVG
jgi:chromosome segregation ATPase